MLRDRLSVAGANSSVNCLPNVSVASLADTPFPAKNRPMSALPPKADIDRSGWNVCFVPEANVVTLIEWGKQNILRD
jgi:hypothetical protein